MLEGKIRSDFGAPLDSNRNESGGKLCNSEGTPSELIQKDNLEDSKEVNTTSTVEIAISPDGMIRIFGLSEEVLEILCETGLADEKIKKRLDRGM